MSELSILHEAPGDWSVWIQCEKGDPTREANSLCLGVGTNRDEAIASAVYELERMTAKLQERPESVRVWPRA